MSYEPWDDDGGRDEMAVGLSGDCHYEHSTSPCPCGWAPPADAASLYSAYEAGYRRAFRDIAEAHVSPSMLRADFTNWQMERVQRAQEETTRAAALDRIEEARNA